MDDGDDNDGDEIKASWTFGAGGQKREITLFRKVEWTQDVHDTMFDAIFLIERTASPSTEEPS